MPSPTVEVDPGDLLRIELENQNPYGQPTNLHVHGMHVSPKSPGDNVYLNIPSRSAYQFRYPVPGDHVPGMAWYHPHRHPIAQPQVFGGQAGAIIIRGGLDEVPGVGDVRDRIMVFQATQVNNEGRVIATPSDSTPRRQLQLINGQLRPVIDIRPGETQRWRILNGSSDKFLVLRLQGHTMWQIANDGNPLAKPIATTAQFIGPGERREILVRAGTRPGRCRAAVHELRARDQAAELQRADADDRDHGDRRARGGAAPDPLGAGTGRGPARRPDRPQARDRPL